MKRLVDTYTFIPSLRQIVFPTFTEVDIDRLLLITNLTYTGRPNIYVFTGSGVGGSVPYVDPVGGVIIQNLLTLQYDTTQMSVTDNLQIFYDYPEDEVTMAITSEQLQDTNALLGQILTELKNINSRGYANVR
jgi:hypothetical protein